MFWHTIFIRYVFFVYEHFPLRTLYHTSFMNYDLSAYELFLTDIWHTNIIHTIFCPTPFSTEHSMSNMAAVTAAD